jgi:glycosyltransferase involved in cell wall biosynthesis
MLKIKIVHIVENLHFGGAQRFVIDLCNEVAKVEKYDVYIISLCDNNSQNTLVNEIESNVHYISFYKNKGLSISAFYKLTLWLKKECPHIVHSHLNALEYLYLYRLYDTRTSFFHTIHKPVEVECPNLFFKRLRMISYRGNHVIPISISQNSSRAFREHYKVYNDVIIQLARPVLKTTSEQIDLRDKYSVDKDCFLMLHVGNINNGKNQQLLLRSIQLYNQTAVKKCRLLMIGEVKDRELYQELSELMQADPYIEFVGPKHNVADYFSIADGFCLSSTYDGIPISLIEAMSFGCVPICTAVGGIKELIIDGVTGFLSKGIEVDSYCKALQRALHFADKEGIKDNLKKLYFSKHQINASALKHINSYNKALNLFEGRDNAFELLYKSKT